MEVQPPTTAKKETHCVKIHRISKTYEKQYNLNLSMWKKLQSQI